MQKANVRRYEIASPLGGEKTKISKQLITLFVWVLFVTSFLWLCKALFLGFYPDFSGYYYGSKYLLENSNPYFGGGGLFTSFVYPPIVLLLFLPFTILTFQMSEIVWTILNFIFLLSSLYMLSSILDVRFFSKINLLLMSLVFISFPIKFSFGMGQINILVLMLLVISYWLLVKKKEFLSGVFLGVSLVIKLFPLLLLVYFLLKHQKKIILGMIVVILLSVLLVLIFVPLKTSSQFITNILPSFLSSWKLDYYNQSLGGFIGRSFGTGNLANILKIIFSFIFISITFFAVLKNKQKDFVSFSLKFGTLITASLMINTFSWQHHFVWLIIPFFAMFSKCLKLKKKVLYLFILSISYVLVSINFPNPKILPVIFQSHVFFGVLILFVLNVYLLLQKLSFVKKAKL